MRYILIIVGLFLTGTLQAQFTGTDSLRNYNNRYITNNPATAFTNLRLHTLLRGMIDYIDTARAGTGGGGAVGVDTLWALNDTTIRYRKNGVFRNFILKGVYDSRRKVDTAYALNDSTLQIKINGTNRNIILPGRHWNLQGVLNNGSTLTENENIVLADSLQFTSGWVVIDSLRLRSLPETIDTTTYKPVAAGPNGNTVRMGGWPGSGSSTDTFTLGRNLVSIDDTLKTVDTLISATPDIGENSTIVATTEWVKDQAYGTGSGSAAGSTGDVQFKGSDGLLKAAPSGMYVWDSVNARLYIGDPSVTNNRVEVEGNINANNGSFKIDDGNVLNVNGGTQLRIGEAGFISSTSIRTLGTQRVYVDNTVMQVAPPLDVANTIRVGGVDIIKDMDPELYIGSGAYWRKINIRCNGVNVGYIDTARWGLGNTAPTARLHLTPFGTSQYGAALKIASGSLLAGEEAGAIENDGDHIYYTDNAGARHQLDQQSGSSYTFTNGLTESGGTAKLGGTLTENTTINTGGFTTDWTGSNDSETSFTVTNTGSTAASAIAGTVTGSTGAGVTGTSTSGNGVVGTSSSNYGVVGTSSTTAAFRGQINVSSSNAVENIISLLRTSSSGAGANGLGAAIQYELETATNGTSQTAGRLAFLWTDATNASRTSAFEIYGVNNTTTARKAALAGSGQWTWDTYGQATHSVTPATTPVISSSGVVGERIAPKFYTALLSQSGASAPTAAVLGTNEIGSIVWTRNSTGNYTGTLSSAFTSNKTWLIVQQGDQSGSFVNNILSWTDANSLLLTTTDNTGTPTDGFTNMSIEIRVYP